MQTHDQHPQAPRPDSNGRARWTLAVLTLAYVFSFLDRIVINLLVEPMKRDLGLSDVQVSLLMGFSFAVFYTLCGLPLGWLADRCDRRKLIAAGIAVWSAATVACGLVRGYAGLFVARLAVGAGEATLTPAAHSMLADLYPRDRLGRAMAVYAMGIYIGSGLALLLGALAIRLAEQRTMWSLPLAGQVFPWQMVFVFVGLPGLLVALAVLALREPPRRDAPAPLSWRESRAWMRAERGFLLPLMGGMGLVSLVAYAGAAWIPSAFVRSFGFTPVQAALLLGGMTAVFSVAGCVAGGLWSDRLAHRGGAAARLNVGAAAGVVLAASAVALAAAPSATWAAAALAPLCFAMALPFGAASAALAERAPPRLRGQASALYLLAVSVLGIGLGPTAVALVTERVLGDAAALRQAIGWVCAIAGLGGAALLWRAARAGDSPARAPSRRTSAAA
jgi:MFS family permease